MDIKRPERMKGVLARKIGDECMLYDPDKGAVHVINATAEFVWAMCDGSHSVQDMIRRMIGKFQVQDGTNIKSDIENVLTRFKKIEVIR